MFVGLNGKTNTRKNKLMSKRCFLPLTPGLPLLPCPALSYLLGWVAGGSPQLGVQRSRALGDWVSAGQAWGEDPGPCPLLGLGARGGVQPASVAPPSRPLLLLSLCGNQKIPVQRREMGLFLATVGEKANASLLFKKTWCVCWADAELGSPKPLPAVPPPQWPCLPSTAQ